MAIDNIQKILSENNLKCVQSHPYYYDLRTSSEETVEEYEFAMKQAIIATGKLGGKWIESWVSVRIEKKER